MYSTASAQCSGPMSVTDSLELVYFYNNFGGDNWDDNSGWLEEPVSEWVGITLTEVEDSCYVLAIESNPTAEFSGTGVIGPIYDFNFPHIENLIFVSENIFGEIIDFQFMPKLKILKLSLNGAIYGAIPDFQYMPNLEELYLDATSLDGPIPDFTNLANLKLLSMSIDDLNSSIPDFSNLPNLEYLSALSASINGNLPSFSNCSNLEWLALGGNNLSGDVPNLDLEELTYLSLSENNLEGSIAFVEGLESIEDLILDKNNFTGSIPNLDELSNLKRLYLADNELEGEIPNFNLPNLWFLELQNNNFEGEIPNFNITEYLRKIYVYGNQLSGQIPEFDNLSILQDLIFCPGNNFYGAIPNLFNSPDINSSDVDWDCIYNADITGHAYWDQNDNCTLDGGDLPIINAFVAIDNGYYVQTDENGYYNLGSDTGLHVIDYYPPSIIFQQSCEDSQTVEVDSLSQIIEDINFANEATIECPYLIVDIVSPPLFQGEPTTYSVSYCNGGTATAEDAHIDIKFHSTIEIISSDLSYYTVNNLLRFEINDLSPADCGSFSIEAFIPEDIPLNSAICANASIFPYEACTDTLTMTADWDGSDLTVQAYCLEGVETDSIRFVIINEGATFTENEGQQWRIYQDDLLVSWDGIIMLESGDSLEVFQEVELNTDGENSTYRMVVEQGAGHPSLSNPQVVVEGCGGFPFSTAYVTSQMLPDSDPFTESECLEVRVSEGIMGSDLQAMSVGGESVGMIASPKGMFDEHFIPLGAELEYLIWFHLPASEEEGDSIDIFITDTLDQIRLDIPKLKIAQVSHEYKASIRDTNVLIFEMNGIPLNETKQLAYVKFKINIKDGFEGSDTLYNQANISFNQGVLIETDRKFHTIGIEEINIPAVSTDNLNSKKNNLMQHYPNPCDQLTTLLIKEKNIESSNFFLIIQDIYGETHYTNTINQSQNTISTKDLPTGIYFLQLYNEAEELLQVKKLIVQH